MPLLHSPQTTTGRRHHISVFIRIARPNLDLAGLVCSSRRNEAACVPFEFLDQMLMLSICKDVFLNKVKFHSLNYLPTLQLVTCHGIWMLTVKACRGLQRAKRRLETVATFTKTQTHVLYYELLIVHIKQKFSRQYLLCRAHFAFIRSMSELQLGSPIIV